RPGSVVVDLVADQGGNVAGSVPGQELSTGGVLIWGGQNVPSQLPVPASQLYAQNVLNLILLLVRDGKVHLDFDDEIVAASCVTHDGEVRHRQTHDLIGEVG
ncbi:MAG: NAD(P)(+) transhydrogenase (Re/Si-specific) subunit alpha, partial [Actinopolymorphaceae bacterium]